MKRTATTIDASRFANCPGCGAPPIGANPRPLVCPYCGRAKEANPADASTDPKRTAEPRKVQQ